MRFSTLVASITLALASFTAAAPAEIFKRAPEVVYLSTCQFFKTLPNGDNGAFIMYDNEYEYYSDTNASQNGEMAGTNDRVSTHQQVYDQYEKPLPTWIGTRSQTFPSGVLFESTINSNGYQVTAGVKAGTGKNPWHTFTCYRDTDRLLYSVRYGTGDQQRNKYCFARFFCMH